MQDDHRFGRDHRRGRRSGCGAGRAPLGRQSTPRAAARGRPGLPERRPARGDGEPEPVQPAASRRIPAPLHVRRPDGASHHAPGAAPLLEGQGAWAAARRSMASSPSEACSTPSMNGPPTVPKAGRAGRSCRSSPSSKTISPWATGPTTGRADRSRSTARRPPPGAPSTWPCATPRSPWVTPGTTTSMRPRRRAYAPSR